jgi:tripartite-type tricarboxylate transporter receptor subunit TctC
MQRRQVLIAGMALVCAATTSVHAQTFPAKPIRIIVTYAPGGTADVLCREIAARMSPAIGQQVIVDNRPGASGMIGAEALARSEPDGYTIGMLNTSHAAAPFAMKLGFDPKELRTVTLVANVPGLISAHSSVPVNSFADVLALARNKPGYLTYGHPGNLSAGHLAMEMLKQQAKVDILAVAYKGGAPALADLLGGQIHLGISGPTAHLPHIKSGKLRPIATTGQKRSSAVPNTPTIAESGMPSFELNEWYGLFAPARTPPELVARLNKGIVQALAAPEVRAKFATLGAEPVGNTPEEFAALFRNEMDRLGKLVDSLGMKKE